MSERAGAAVPGAAAGHPVPAEVAVGLLRAGGSAADAAVGGVPAGCAEVHRRWGRLPWHRVVEPAVDLARQGVPMPTIHASTP